MSGLRARILRPLAGLAIFLALAYPSVRLYPIAMREGYQLCELVGIMDPGGGLGGQVAGFNFQRDPGWAHWLVRGVAGLAAFAPALLLAFAAATPGVIGRGPAICGRCGRALLGVSEPACPSCREVFT